MINKFSVRVNNDISKGSLNDRSSQLPMTLTFMFLYLFLSRVDNSLNSTQCTVKGCEHREKF